ncbi:MAG: glutamate--cysteine ligase [Actinomycetota bacterium]|nr:glutamate--cysteine ligase [Actinomycetota bacterium]
MSRRTVGVEEELLLFDRGTTHLAKLGDILADDDGQSGLPSVEHEFKRQQIETATSPLPDMDSLHREIVRGRREVAHRARASGVAPAALATDPAPGLPATTDDLRYHRIMDAFGVIAASQLTCGMHVHVSVDSRDEGVAVIDRVRRWLPALLAMSANSPFAEGADTGYASYRNVIWGRWPTAGPADVFASLGEYERVVEQLIATGAAMDEGMIYFDARLGVGYPTVEIRVMDVVPTAQDAVVLAALCRGLVDTAVEDWRSSEPPPDLPLSFVRAATWRAARFGLTGELVDPRAGGLAPAGDVLEGLLAHTRKALFHNGDGELVTRGVQQLLARGTGAAWQRASFARRQSMRDVVSDALDWTVTD